MKAKPPATARIESGRTTVTRQLLGWREVVALPALDIPMLKAKVDTGARTCALHAVDAEAVVVEGKHCVRFAIPEEQTGIGETIYHTAPVRDRRHIKSSTGHSQKRFVIFTRVQIGSRSFNIEITLSDRSNMDFPMLLGRNLLRLGRYVIHPGRSFLQGTPGA